MKKNEHPYQFTAMPVNLTACMDNNCRSMLFTLLQLSSYYQSKSEEQHQKWNGWFFRTNEDLQAQSNLSENLVRATISTLYGIGVIDVATIGKSRGNIPNRFKIDIAKMCEWEKYSIEDCVKNPAYAITIEPYKATGWKPSYLTKIIQTSTATLAQKVPQSEDNIENIENEENIENIDNADNVEKVDNIDYAGTLCRVSTSPSIKSAAMSTYKQREDEIMQTLNETTNFTDFMLVASKVTSLMQDAPSDKVKEFTMQRYRGVVQGRIKYLKAVYEADPDNPMADKFFRFLRNRQSS